MTTGRRKPVKARRRAARAASRLRRGSNAAPDRTAQLRRERDEALQQQKAMAEVLEIIASAGGERLERTFSVILERTTEICEAKFGVMTLYEGGGTFRVVALHNAPQNLIKARQRKPVFQPPSNNPLGHVARTKRVYHTADIRKEAAYLAGDQSAHILADDGGARSVVNASRCSKTVPWSEFWASIAGRSCPLQSGRSISPRASRPRR